MIVSCAMIQWCLLWFLLWYLLCTPVMIPVMTHIMDPWLLLLCIPVLTFLWFASLILYAWISVAWDKGIYMRVSLFGLLLRCTSLMGPWPKRIKSLLLTISFTWISCSMVIMSLYTIHVCIYHIRVLTPYTYLLATWLQLFIVYMSWFLGFAYSDSEAWNEVEPSTEDQVASSNSFVPDSFWLTKSLFYLWASLYLSCTFYFWTCYDKRHMYYVHVYHTVMTLSLYLLCWHISMCTTLCVVLWSSCCTFMLSVYTWGLLLTYVYTSQWRPRIRGNRGVTGWYQSLGSHT